MALEILDREYDLRHRPRSGEESYYRTEACYRLTGSDGLTVRRDSYVGDFMRLVESVEDDVATETITWENVVRRWGLGDGPYEAPESIEWARGCTYVFSPAIGLEDLNEKAKAFPHDMLGWNVFLLAIDAHVEFDLPRSSQSGIDELRRIGDVHTVVPHGDGPGIDFSPFITTSSFKVRSYDLRFAALTMCGGLACAVLESLIRDRAAFDMTMGETAMVSSSELKRTIVSRLADGALERGTSVEWVCANGMWINPVYTIERISRVEFESGLQ
jgi:hypothetical protein